MSRRRRSPNPPSRVSLRPRLPAPSPAAGCARGGMPFVVGGMVSGVGRCFHCMRRCGADGREMLPAGPAAWTCTRQKFRSMRRGTHMEISFSAITVPPDAFIDVARVSEQVGYDGLWMSETSHDPFIGLAAATQATDHIALRAAIAVAFARNPMSTAMLANDMQLVSGGRFAIGLGSQLKSHIIRRFGMPWSHPAARMREYVLAMRAIWDCFETGGRLRFRGEFYRHTLMSDYFNPGPNPYGNPQILVAALGELMTEVAGEVADAVVPHLISTRRYLEEVTLPAVRRGREKAGLTMDGFKVYLSPIVATGSTEAEFNAATSKRSEEHTSELQSRSDLVCRLLLEKKKQIFIQYSNFNKKKLITKQKSY